MLQADTLQKADAAEHQDNARQGFAPAAKSDSTRTTRQSVKAEHISTRPDTLYLPGYGKGKSIKDVSLPQYYRESFFSSNPMLHPELNSELYGVVGDPVPYSVRNDNVITGLLLGCFILAMIAFSHSRKFIMRQAKHFFYIPHGRVTTITETTGEFRFQFFLIFQTCLLASILSFFYTQHNIADTFMLSSQYMLIWIFFGCLTGYFICKIILYALVNWVFFDKKRNDLWLKTFLFITSMEGICLFPLVMLQSYFDLQQQSAVIYALIAIVLTKILTFYKCFTIFFIRSGGFLQIILYFCALELAPLLSLWGVMVMIVDYLKINF